MLHMILFPVVELCIIHLVTADVEFGYVMLIVGSFMDSAVNSNIESIRCFLSANPSTLTSDKCLTDEKMTLVMLAARLGQLLFTT